jgi:y4mF family transcriptional regulator
MEKTNEIAEMIKMHRKAAGLSRIQLSEIAGVGKTVIYDIEKGKETVRLDNLLKILKSLNIKLTLTSPYLENRIS